MERVIKLVRPPVRGRQKKTGHADILSGAPGQKYAIACKCYLPDRGRADGAVLAVHGFAGDKESSAIEAVARVMTEKGKAVVCFDLPCHGSSPVREEFLTVENCISDVITMADYCRETFPSGHFCLFATSFGGFLALLCSDELNDFKTVLRAPAVTMPEHILMDLLHMTPAEFKAAGRVPCGFDRPILLPYRFYEELRQYSVLSGTYEREMLIIQGDANDVVPCADILQFCAGRPNILLQIVRGADHRFKKPGEIGQAVHGAVKFWTK